jgi:hypothetical protein
MKSVKLRYRLFITLDVAVVILSDERRAKKKAEIPTLDKVHSRNALDAQIKRTEGGRTL